MTVKHEKVLENGSNEHEGSKDGEQDNAVPELTIWIFEEVNEVQEHGSIPNGARFSQEIAEGG